MRNLHVICLSGILWVPAYPWKESRWILLMLGNNYKKVIYSHKQKKNEDTMPSNKKVEDKKNYQEISLM